MQFLDIAPLEIGDLDFPILGRMIVPRHDLRSDLIAVRPQINLSVALHVVVRTDRQRRCLATLLFIAERIAAATNSVPQLNSLFAAPQSR